MLASLSYNLERLAHFRGRESRALFWPYAACVVVPLFVASLAVMVPELKASFDRMLRYAADHPDEATVSQGPGQISVTIDGFHPELMPDLARIAIPLAVILAVAVVLLAAAVSRRLHDRDWSGLWGLLPLPFLGFGYHLFANVFGPGGAEEFDVMLFLGLLLNNALYVAALLLLIVQLAKPGTSEKNRYD